jgi:SAM-dependent methyltransferase
MIPKVSSNKSFRDPAGCLVEISGRLIRFVNRVGAEDAKAFLGTTLYIDSVIDGRLVPSRILDSAEITDLNHENKQVVSQSELYEMVLEHKRVSFVSFPSEWAPEMLHAAALLTLDLARAGLDQGFALKDATPYNVLFQGPFPIFIDILSFEKLKPGEHIWLAYAQLVRTFLLPLLVNKRFNLPLEYIFLSSRDGIEPEKVYRMESPLRRLLPPFINLVSIPVWLGNKHSDEDNSIYDPHLLKDSDKATFILKLLFSNINKLLNRLCPLSKQTSVWSNYLDKNNNYSNEQFDAKCSFIKSVMKEYTPQKVLDVGCNTGFFSAIAANNGASVVAIDYDPVVVGEVWRKAKQENLDILPLVVNLAHPTPAMGWRNAETPSFLERAKGSFDCLLMLAVVHHMLVTEGIPLGEIIDLAAEITTDVLVIEYVDPEDTMFKRLTRGREHLYTDLSKDVFEYICDKHFTILRCLHLTNSHRWLYTMRKKY